MSNKVTSIIVISVAVMFVLSIAILGSDKITGAATKCIDSDRGANVGVKGTTSDSKGSYEDRCEGATLVEYFCSGRVVKSKSMKCSSKTTCSEGACVNNILLGSGPTYYCCTGSKTGNEITTDVNCNKKHHWDSNRCSGQPCIDLCKKQGYSGGMIVGNGCKCGSATAPAPCTNDCSSGETRCSAKVEQTCGNYDTDSCSEWPTNTIGKGNEDCTVAGGICSRGLCAVTTLTCEDTDMDYNGYVGVFGNNTLVAGTCTDSSGTHTDVCTYEDKAYESQYDLYWKNHVVEYYCEAGSCKSTLARCGEVCSEGTCH